jgi:release factor glutamine methyltransferase
MTTIRDALNSALAQFRAISESPGLDAQLLMAHMLHVERAWLLAHDDDSLTDEQQSRYAGWVQRRAAGEPIAYILGRRAFYDREILVAPGVLIPRPETELLLEAALTHAASLSRPIVADIGTGSGALAVTFAANCPTAQVYAVDISPQALQIARHNAEQNQASVTFFEGDLLAPLIERGIKCDILMANLPYIAHDELSQLAVSAYEPHLALDGGPDGLDLVRRLIADLRRVCDPGALALLEIGADQGAAALAIAQQIHPQAAAIIPDYAGLDRIVRKVL